MVQSDHSHSLSHRQSTAIGQYVTIFQAELLAILQACRHISYLSTPLPPVHFGINNMEVLKSLSSTIICSHTGIDTLQALNTLGSRSQVTLHCVPAHSNVPGNELTGSLANLGSDSSPFGPPPFAPIAASAHQHHCGFLYLRQTLL